MIWIAYGILGPIAGIALAAGAVFVVRTGLARVGLVYFEKKANR